MPLNHIHAISPIEKAFHNSANQRFHYDAKSGHITGFDGRVLDVEGANKAPGAKLLYYDKNGNANQQFDYKDGQFVTRMGTGFVIDVSGGPNNVKNGGELILWNPTGGANQKWDVDAHGYIRSRVNANFVIDVNGGAKPAKGSTPVSVWTAAVSSGDAGVLATINNGANQRFHYDGNHIIGFDGRVLDVEGANKAAGAKLIFYDKGNNQPNQQFDFKDGQFISRLGTGFVIDVSGGPNSVKDGGQLILWNPTGGANQKWDIDQHGYIRSRVNAKFVIDVNGGAKPAKGLTAVSVWTASL